MSRPNQTIFQPPTPKGQCTCGRPIWWGERDGFAGWHHAQGEPGAVYPGCVVPEPTPATLSRYPSSRIDPTMPTEPTPPAWLPAGTVPTEPGLYVRHIAGEYMSDLLRIRPPEQGEVFYDVSGSMHRVPINRLEAMPYRFYGPIPEPDDQ